MTLFFRGRPHPFFNNQPVQHPFGGFRGSDPAFLTERAFTGHKANNTASNDLGLIYMNARYYVGAIGRFASADTLVPDQNDPQALNRYAYARNNPLLIVDPSGHCWGFASGLRNTFYATTCNNLDMAVSIVQHPDASVAEKVVAGAYIVTEGVAHTAVLVGSTVVIVETAPAAIPYVEAAIAKATTTALAHETTTAVLGGIAETAVECSMTGGGCNYWDYAAGAITAGVAHRLSTPNGGCSFSEDTAVSTENGLVPIGEVEEGTYVLTFNEETGELGYYPVIKAWVHEDPVIVLLTVDGELVEATPEHPFFVENHGWVEAGELWVGAKLFSAADIYGELQAIAFEEQPQLMYDLTVAEVHTFFVGQQQWLVHNCGGIRGAASGSGDSGGPNAGNAITPAQRSANLQINAATNSNGHYWCTNCGYENTNPSHFDIDHIVPRSHGGNNNQSNRRVLCVGCNRSAQEGWPPRAGSDWATKYPDRDMRQ